ncbi:hypothetical protein C8J27_1139 [Rhodobacter aestuarii]|uniref:Uncharacterized protein n=1 Tax=Rhodobacter aestuarii TaxID=453582 RepID=A0A1N7QBR0_9RHOB|nr:hypothetical protein [Rhodobacter aestuarii]PTV93644.1 hypothetical protein C8J27_1139 [Rhodobacter aestuarii]SIT19987.1 hypothetical protein SAMN05421580_1159 [Rhodobacter aestuarii]
MSARREKYVKVRFFEEELSLLETLRQSAGSESRTVFIRRRALEPEIGTQAIADLVGQVGVTLNTEDIDPKQLDHLALLLDGVTLELRRIKKS